MLVKWIEFENLETGLKIERVEFNRDITLLVGVSGAGKTQILNAVKYSLELAISEEEMLLPYHCKLGIETDNKEYEWEYVIKKNENKEILTVDKEEYCFARESLKKGKEQLFLREFEKVQIIGYDRVPMPKKSESLLSQYAEDEVLNKVVQEIDKLYSIGIGIDAWLSTRKEAFDKYIWFFSKTSYFYKKDENISRKVLSQLPTDVKLHLVKRYFKETYSNILYAVKDIFSEIEDIDVIEDTQQTEWQIVIRVYGKQLKKHEISNGMLKCIYYIVELYTMSENSVVLIEEFENGLGENCISVLAELIMEERKDLQFIITSHHPKIINGIEPSKWRIIDREVSVIKNYSSEQYGITNSKHEPYFNLVNRLAFEGKI